MDISKTLLIYQELAKKSSISHEELKNLGYSETQIQGLVNFNYLKVDNLGYYQVDDEALVNEIYNLVKLKKLDNQTAIKLYEEIIKRNPTCQRAALNLFYNCIYNYNYSQALEYFKMCFSPSTKFNFYNYFIYILNFITELPEDLKKVVKINNFKNIMLDCANQDLLTEEEINMLNEIRESAFSSNWKQAHELISEYYINYTKIGDYTAIEKHLLAIAKNKYFKINNEIKRLISKHEYQEALATIEKFLLAKSRSHYWKAIVTMLKDIILLQEQKRIPNYFNHFKNREYSKFTYAILDHNYVVAQKMLQQYSCDNPIINKLMPVITELQTNLQNKTKDVRETFNNENTKIIDITNYEKTIEDIHNYLNKIAKSEYEFLVINLLKISLKEGDLEFTEIKNILKDLKDNNYDFDLLEIIGSFKKAISTKNYEIAKLYFDIINQATILNQSYPYKASLEADLKSIEPEEIEQETLSPIIEEIDDAMLVEETEKPSVTVLEKDLEEKLEIPASNLEKTIVTNKKARKKNKLQEEKANLEAIKLEAKQESIINDKNIMEYKEKVLLNTAKAYPIINEEDLAKIIEDTFANYNYIECGLSLELYVHFALENNILIYLRRMYQENIDKDLSLDIILNIINIYTNVIQKYYPLESIDNIQNTIEDTFINYNEHKTFISQLVLNLKRKEK